MLTPKKQMFLRLLENTIEKSHIISKKTKCGKATMYFLYSDFPSPQLTGVPNFLFSFLQYQ